MCAVDVAIGCACSGSVKGVQIPSGIVPATSLFVAAVAVAARVASLFMLGAAGVGLATLIGVVVNNSILLDAFIGEHRAAGMPILEAGRKAVLVPGEAEETTSLALQTSRIGARALREALSPLEPLGRVVLVGTFTAPGARDDPPTVAVSGDRVTLSYAGPDRIAALGEARLREVDLVAQVRHAPGVAVPVVSLPPAGRTALPEALDRWTDTGCAGGEAACPP